MHDNGLYDPWRIPPDGLDYNELQTGEFINMN